MEPSEVVASDGRAWDAPRRRSKAVRAATLFIYLLAALGVVRAVIIAGAIWLADGVVVPGPLPQLHVVDPGPLVVDFVRDMPLWLRVLSTLPALTVAGVGLAAAFLLSSILARIGRGEAFAVRTQLALARLSFLLVVGSVIAFLVDCGAVLAVQQYLRGDVALPVDYTLPGPSFPVFLVALGSVAAALQFAFRDGATLERDAEGVN